MLNTHYSHTPSPRFPFTPSLPVSARSAAAAPFEAKSRLPQYIGASHIHVDAQDWPGAYVAVANIHAQNTVFVDLERESDLVLVSLEEVGCPLRLRDKGARPSQTATPRRSVSVIPAGSPVEGEAHRPQYLRHLLLCLDRPRLERDFGDDLDIGEALGKKLMHTDERLMRIVQLITEECTIGGSVNRLFADGLMLAFLSSLAAAEEPEATTAWSRGGLAPWQLRRAMDYLLENLAEDIDLEQLASLVELSKSHFSRGFRASTGHPPHRWLLAARIDRAKSLLLGGKLSLAEIALDVGFADQSHFTRTFTKMVEVSPRAWLRQRL